MALPCALFSSSSNNYKPEEFIKQILRLPELPQPCILNDDIQGYEWSFETKYYSTTIHLCATNARTIGSQEFADNLQAFVHFFDPNESESFELTKAWTPYLEHIEPTIQILVCETSKDTDVINRKKTLEWCISHGFELVELNPEEDDDADEEDDFLETTGMARIVQALHSHTWSNLELKENPSIQSPYFRQLMKEQHLLNQQEASSKEEQNADTDKNCSHTAEVPCDSAPEKNLENDSMSEKKSIAESAETETNKTECVSDVNGIGETAASTDSNSSVDAFGMNNVDWTALMGADLQNTDGELADQELGVEEFEQLFQRLKVMKDKAETLPPEERKKYAEKVAVSFWKAIGGDEDEITGLDEDLN